MCRNSLFLLFYCKGQFLTQITPFQQHNIRTDGMSLELLLFRYRSHHSQQQLPTQNTPPPSPSGLAMSWHNMGLQCHRLLSSAELACFFPFCSSSQNHYGYSPANIHFIGHSLGAHAAGEAGRRKPGIARITGTEALTADEALHFHAD